MFVTAAQKGQRALEAVFRYYFADVATKEVVDGHDVKEEEVLLALARCAVFCYKF